MGKRNISHFQKVAILWIIIIFTMGSALFYILSQKHKWFERSLYYFITMDNTRGLKVGTEVTMLGMPIGKIDSISFNDQNKLIVKLSIKQSFTEKVRIDSYAQLYRPLLISDLKIEIVPGKKHKGKFKTKMESNAYMKVSPSKELIDMISHGKLEKYFDTFENTFESVKMILQEFNKNKRYTKVIGIFDELLPFIKNVSSLTKRFADLINDKDTEKFRRNFVKFLSNIDLNKMYAFLKKMGNIRTEALNILIKKLCSIDERNLNKLMENFANLDTKQINKLLNNSNLEQLLKNVKNISTQVSKSKNLTTLIDKLAVVTYDLSKSTYVLPELLKNLNSLYYNIVTIQKDITSASSSLNSMSGNLNNINSKYVENEKIAKMVGNLSKISENLAQISKDIPGLSKSTTKTLKEMLITLKAIQKSWFLKSHTKKAIEEVENDK